MLHSKQAVFVVIVPVYTVIRGINYGYIIKQGVPLGLIDEFAIDVNVFNAGIVVKVIVCRRIACGEAAARELPIGYFGNKVKVMADDNVLISRALIIGNVYSDSEFAVSGVQGARREGVSRDNEIVSRVCSFRSAEVAPRRNWSV